MFLGSPRLSCRLSGKLGRGSPVGVSTFTVSFRSASRAAMAYRYRVFPFCFPYRAVSSYRRFFAPFIVSGGGASGGKRRGPSRTLRLFVACRGTVSLCSPLYPSRLWYMKKRGGWVSPSVPFPAPR